MTEMTARLSSVRKAITLDWVERLPPELRKALGEHIDREFEAGIEADIAEVDEQIKATMPGGRSTSRPVQPLNGPKKVPE